MFSLAFLASQSFGLSMPFTSIKPVAQQVTPVLSDEQQGILAVRSVKASVVNIVGTGKPQNDGKQVEVVYGTGFIIDPDGFIVSNNHIVEDSNMTFTVVFADGNEYPATVLGQDQYSDVALLKIEAKGLPVVRLGDPQSLETGQTVFAIGNSLGKYQNTVTRGVVSGLGRIIDWADVANATTSSSPQPRMQNLIQTDAAINPGNSGGPLITMAGEVVGMNTFIDTSAEGVGFAVPISAVRSSVDQLRAFGKVSKPYLGVVFLTLSKTRQLLQQTSVSQGALITSVAPDSPAARAGITGNDIITHINHEQLTETNELDAVLSKYEAGNQVLVTLLRKGESIDLPLIIGEYNK